MYNTVIAPPKCIAKQEPSGIEYCLGSLWVAFKKSNIYVSSIDILLFWLNIKKNICFLIEIPHDYIAALRSRYCVDYASSKCSKMKHENIIQYTILHTKLCTIGDNIN